MTEFADTAGGAVGTHSVIVRPEQAGRRLDVILSELMPDLSRSRIKALIRDGCVQTEDVPLLAPAAKPAPGTVLEVELPPPQDAALTPEAIPLSIAYEDDHLLVVDKPAGLVVHPGAGNPGSTLVNALLAHCGPSLSGIGGVRRPGIVHRIDKDTSGLLVVAKEQATHAALVEMFAAHAVHRRYLAVTTGVPAPPAGTVSTMIGRAPNDRKRMAVLSEGRGKPAVTHYRTQRAWGSAAALIECRLETGRTHQIRVHMAHIRAPLVGDRTYLRWTGERKNKLPTAIRESVIAFPRQALHAAELGFDHPVGGTEMRFKSAVPADFQGLLDSLDEASRA